RQWDQFLERYAIPILEGLAYAHARGIAHRDITPQNIRLDNDGVAKITDFGIAKLDAALSIGTTVRGNRTEPYAPPPDQESAREFFTRDIYAFGVLVMLAIAGVDPFTPEFQEHPYGSIQKARQQLKAPPALRAFLERCVNPIPE